MTRRKLAIACTAGILVALATACDPPSGTIDGTLINDGTTQRAIQYNVQGTNSSLEGYNTNTMDSIVDSLLARNPKPYAISFNEVCFPQWLQIWNSYFASRGYIAEAVWGAHSPYADGLPASSIGAVIPGSSNPTRYYSRLNGTCSLFGNVVVELGTSALRNVVYYVNQASSNIGGNKNEFKGAVCVLSNLSHRPYIYQTSWSDHHWYEAYL